MRLLLLERLTFDQMFRYSEPKRVKRSYTVRGPPLDIDANSDAIYHSFNFKSFPSTTGLRHHGYIKFVRPPRRNANQMRLQNVPCVVDCSCPDFKYRWAWVLKQHQSSAVGPSSMNQALNRAPRITNPAKIPGLCKHLLACRDYIYGLLAKFPQGEPDTAEKLDKLIQYGKDRWSDFPGATANAKERTAWFQKANQARRMGQEPPPGPPPRYWPREGKPEEEEEPGVELAQLPPPEPEPEARGPVLPMAGRPALGPTTGSTRYAQAAAKAGFPTTAAHQAMRKLGDSRAVSPGTHVVKATNAINAMKTLEEAQKIVEELEDAERAHEEMPGAPEGALGTGDESPELPPSEPPVSDDAVGADTEGNVALQLLHDIKELLTQILQAEDPAAADEEAELPEEPSEDAEDAAADFEAPPEDEEEEVAGHRPVPTE